MKKTFLTFAIAMSFVLFSCNNNTSQTTETEEVATEEHDEHHHDTNSDSEEIQLINGEKWAVNVEMKPFISNGESLVDEYINSESTDYKALAESLKAENQSLIKSCTMDGQSHDELHKWLHPHLELVQELSEAEDVESAIVLVHQIHASYISFHDYFQ